MPILNVGFVSSRPVAEHRLFIPSVGLCVVLGIYAQEFWSRRYFKIIFYSVVSIMFIFSFNRNFVWKDSLTLWQTTLQQGCETERVYTNLAVAFEEKNALNEAMASYILALEKSPDNKTVSKIYTNIAVLYEKNNQSKEAVEYLKKALEENPDYFFAHKLLARIYEKEGLYMDALRELEKVLAANKNDFDVILSNPPQTAGKELCFKLIEESKNYLKYNGSLQLVARHKKGGNTLSKKMEEVFGNVKVIAKKSGYFVYLSVKD